MKRTILSIALALCVGCAFAQSNAFAKLADIKGVEHVNINKTMLNLAAKSGGNFDFGDGLALEGMEDDMIKKMENIRIYNCEDKEGAEAFGIQVGSILSGRGWEALMVGAEDGEKLNISQFKKGKKSTIAIFHEEEGESSLIVIEGKLDFKKIIEAQMK